MGSQIAATSHLSSLLEEVLSRCNLTGPLPLGSYPKILLGSTLKISEWESLDMTLSEVASTNYGWRALLSVNRQRRD